jgi:hypothetical protein
VKIKEHNFCCERTKTVRKKCLVNIGREMNWKDRKDDWKKNAADPLNAGKGTGKADGFCTPKSRKKEWK